MVEYKFGRDGFDQMKERMYDKGWEGLILRAPIEYVGKKTSNIIKYKDFVDAEYTVLDVEPTVKPMLRNGVMQKVVCLGSVVIEHKGVKVNVGSGFTDEQRVEFHENPSLILGKEITVKYKKETTNKQGLPSLEFPTLKVIHGEKREF